MNPAKQVRRTGAPANEFFLNGEGINRQVLQTELCKFLGNDAISRPAEHDGQRGFKITAVRPFTSAMIEDLQKMSADYESEANRYKARGQAVRPYEDSYTRQNIDEKVAMPQDSREPYLDSRYPPPQDKYPYQPEGYPQYGQGYAPQPGFPQQQGFPPGGPYAPQDGYMQFSSAAPGHGMTATSRGGGYAGDPQYAPNYTYNQGMPGMPNQGMPGQGFYRPPFDPPRTQPDEGYYPPRPTAGGRGEDPSMNMMPDNQYGGGSRPQQPSPYDPNAGPYQQPRRR